MSSKLDAPIAGELLPLAGVSVLMVPVQASALRGLVQASAPVQVPALARGLVQVSAPVQVPALVQGLAQVSAPVRGPASAQAAEVKRSELSAGKVPVQSDRDFSRGARLMARGMTLATLPLLIRISIGACLTEGGIFTKINVLSNQ